MVSRLHVHWRTNSCMCAPFLSLSLSLSHRSQMSKSLPSPALKRQVMNELLHVLSMSRSLSISLIVKCQRHFSSALKRRDSRSSHRSGLRSYETCIADSSTYSLSPLGAMDAGSAAALYAGSIVLRKTFEAVAQRSLSSIFTSLHARFRGQDHLQTLQRELESRLQVLSLPVDMCIQHVLHGNTALQGALDMVILLINDIVSFQEELEAQAYNESLTKLSQNEAAKRLEGFLSRLDSILPYLALAVNAVSLLRTAHLELSPSRLMEASHLIRNADGNNGLVMCMTAKLHKFETRLTLPRWQEKMLLCDTSLRKSANRLVSMSDDFELIFADRDTSEEDHAIPLSFPADRLTAIGSSTLHVLGLGEHNLEGVLLLDLMDSSSKLSHYALQCIEDHEGHTDGSSNDDDNATDEIHRGSSLVGSTSRISRLSLLEYVLRLCMLENREEKNHWDISDERIKMFFSDPRLVSEPKANVQKVSVTRGMDSIKLTPNPKKKVSSDPSIQTPPTGSARQHSRRLSITEMFYDLQLDSPAKTGRDVTKS